MDDDEIEYPKVFFASLAFPLFNIEFSYNRRQQEAELKLVEEETERRVEEAIMKKVEEKLKSAYIKLEIDKRLAEGRKKLIIEVAAQLEKEKEAALIRAKQKEASSFSLQFVWKKKYATMLMN